MVFARLGTHYTNLGRERVIFVTVIRISRPVFFLFSNRALLS